MERGKMLLSRRNQLLLEFSFWNEPVPRDGPNIYELRSYQLRVSPTVCVTFGLHNTFTGPHRGILVLLKLSLTAEIVHVSNVCET